MSTILNKESLIEIVCGKCPATCWGEKSICRTHDRHVGMIEKCPEWDKYLLEQQGLQEHDGQLAITNMEPAMEWLQKAEELIKGYRYLVNKAAWLRTELERSISSTPSLSNRLVASYGDDAGMPSGKGLKISTLNIPEAVYNKKIRRLEELEKKIKQIDEAALTIQDVQEKAVLECMLDGEKMNLTAFMVGVSRQRLYEIRKNIIIKIAQALFEGTAA
ncbi:hypothetical protein ABE137_06555 [Brevibacillus laterosporus]|uniref:hypothetical protein n=1 Tax=Brevibacillus laterosporus TaxID=1465 RepID=UPI003D1DB90D